MTCRRTVEEAQAQQAARQVARNSLKTESPGPGASTFRQGEDDPWRTSPPTDTDWHKRNGAGKMSETDRPETQADLHEFTMRLPEAVALCGYGLAAASAPTSVHALRQRCLRGTGPHHIVDKSNGEPGETRFRPEDVLAWIRSHQPEDMRQAFEIEAAFNAWLQRWEVELPDHDMVAEAVAILEGGE